jgi:ABC-type bacteriocin/lantibiotic exporter with double-glycine peptidase domain
MWKPYLKIIKNLNRGELFFIAVLGLLAIISALCEFISIAIIFPFISTLSGNTGSPSEYTGISLKELLDLGNKYTVQQLTALAILAFLFSGAIRIIFMKICAEFTTKIGLSLSEKIFSNLLHDEYITHLNRNSGDIVSVLSVKFKIVINDVLFSTVLLFGNLFIIIFLSIVMISINPLIAIIVFGGIFLIYAFISRLMKKHIYSNSEKISIQENKTIRIIQESIGGIRDVILENNFNYFLNLFKTAQYKVLKAQANNHFIANAPRYAIEAIGFSSLVFAAYLFSIKNEPSELIPLFGVIAIAAQRVIPLAQQCFWSLSHIRGAKNSFEEVVGYLPDTAYKKDPSTESNCIDKVDFRENIVLNNISFFYQKEISPVILNLSLTINKGERIGIFGKSGAGKSTLVDILMGLLSPTNGHLEVDGLEINEATRKSWQKKIAHVPQTIYLTDSTLLENIAFGLPEEKIDLDKALTAAVSADLGGLIDSLPKGLKSRVGENGSWLSGGQRQRVGIARALYRNAELIIFDESTSSLDSESEKNIIDSIGRINKAITLIMIAHRPSSLQLCSKILCFEDYGVRLMHYEEFINSAN